MLHFCTLPPCLSRERVPRNEFCNIMDNLWIRAYHHARHETMNQNTQLRAANVIIQGESLLYVDAPFLPGTARHCLLKHIRVVQGNHMFEQNVDRQDSVNSREADEAATPDTQTSNMQ